MISTFVFVVIIAVLLWALILIWVISSANEAKRRDKIQLQYQKLLALMAEKPAVDIIQINAAIGAIYCQYLHSNN